MLFTEYLQGWKKGIQDKTHIKDDKMIKDDKIICN